MYATIPVPTIDKIAKHGCACGSSNNRKFVFVYTKPLSTKETDFFFVLNQCVHRAKKCPCGTRQKVPISLCGKTGHPITNILSMGQKQAGTKHDDGLTHYLHGSWTEPHRREVELTLDINLLLCQTLPPGVVQNRVRKITSRQIFRELATCRNAALAQIVHREHNYRPICCELSPRRHAALAQAVYRGRGYRQVNVTVIRH